MSKDTKLNYMEIKTYKLVDMNGGQFNALKARVDDGIVKVITDDGNSLPLGRYLLKEDMMDFINDMVDPLLNDD